MCQSGEWFAAVAGVASRSTYSNVAAAHDRVYVTEADQDLLSRISTIPGLCLALHKAISNLLCQFYDYVFGNA